MATITMFFVLSILFILITFVPIPSFSCPLLQKQALLNFKSNYDTVFNVSSSDSYYSHPFQSWSPNSDCCYWEDVSCDETRIVTELHLGYLINSFHNPDSVFFDILAPLFHIRSLRLLDISYNNLAGGIPGDGFGNLTELVHLDLSWNSFNGSIPYEFLELTNLGYLDISFNSFEGSIGPKLGMLQNLVSLDLSGNSFTGNIPQEIGNLTKLRKFDISDNQFSGGVPDSIANMKDVETLDFSNNQFEGPISSSIQNLSKLEILWLQDNKLTGEIPTWIFNITTLKSLFLGGRKGNELFWNNKAKIVPRCNLTAISMPSCGISGQIPRWISSATDLIYLDLSGNKLEGRFPYWLAQMDLDTILLFNNKLIGSIPPRLFESPRLYILHLSQNNFSGELPENIGNATSLSFLMVSENNFCGQIPTSMSNMDNLKLLDLSKNKFSGQNFHGFSNNPYLIYLDLSYNEFTGKIPTTFSITTQVLYLGGNKFSGHLPRNLTNLVRLQHLDLHDNDITGHLHGVLPKSPDLQVLVLRNNSFEGFIPTTISDFTNLRILDLSGNNLTGNIPHEIANLTGMIEAPIHVSTSGSIFDDAYHLYMTSFGNKMRFDMKDLTVNWKDNVQDLSSHSLDIYSLLDVSNNRISGEIPASLGNLKTLKVLNMSNNIISGHIPVSFGNLKGIESLDLSHNRISGSIPRSLEKLDGLGILDVSNNQITGKIPMGGHMSTMDEFKYFANNRGLCGMQIKITCPEDILPSEGREEFEDDEKLTWIFWVGTWIGFPIGFFSSIVIMGYLLDFLRLFKLW